jgi:putative acetyltransferase
MANGTRDGGIRTMREGERAALVALWEAAWQAARPDIDFAERRAWFDGYLQELQAAGAEVLVADTADGPAGFATIHPGTGYLDTLVVGLAFQRRGWAGRLLAACRERAPGGVTLKVNTLNRAGRALYAAEGFVEIGREVKAESGETVLVLHRA